MKEELISLETAKLAKKKGFKLQSNPFGFITKFYNHNTGTLLSYGRTGRTDLNKAYYASSQTLLQKWLREVHNIDVNIQMWNGSPKTYKHILQYNKGINHTSFGNYFNIYEEALEEGLISALKAI